MNYKPEDMVVTITLPDGTKHLCHGWSEKSSIFSKKSYHTVSGEWVVDADKEEEDE